MTATVAPFTCPELGITEPHYWAEDARTVSGYSKRTLERRSSSDHPSDKERLTAHYVRGLVCYPVSEIHALREERLGKAKAHE